MGNPATDLANTYQTLSERKKLLLEFGMDEDRARELACAIPMDVTLEALSTGPSSRLLMTRLDLKEDEGEEIYRVSLDGFGSHYRIVHFKDASEERDQYPYEVQVAPMMEDGSVAEDGFGMIGGSPGLPSGSFRTLGGAFGFLRELERGKGTPANPGIDEQGFWDLLEQWEGR